MTCCQIIFCLAVALINASPALSNELADSGFEQAAADRLTAWTPYGRGYALDAREVQSGKLAVRCETTGDQDGMGIAQVIRYDQPDQRPIIVGGWSKAEDIGAGGDYGLYLDIIYEDGTPWWGKTAAWTRGTHGWQYAAEVYYPEKPVREIRAYVFLRRTSGKAWFDSVFLDRGGLHATQVRVLSDFPRRPPGQRIRARLTQAAEWRATLLDSNGRELASSAGHGETIAWDWQDAAESSPARLRLAGEARDEARLDLTVPVSIAERPENPVREGYTVWAENSMRKVYPTEVSTFTTAGYMYQKRRTAPPEEPDYMDWYCPLTSVYDAELSARLRQQGKQVWWYVCCGPQHPYANFAAMDYPSIEGRLLGWMTYGFQADGLLFWHVNLWHPNRIIDGSDPYLDWKPACVANMTGDGCLTYPTPAGPVSSIRLENVRDGLEDYDYLALLADAQGQEVAREYVGRLVTSMTDFTRDPAALSAVRDEIAGRIEAVAPLLK